MSDLSESQSYLFPPVLASTDLHPDIVIYSQTRQEATIIELTIPFETNVENAQKRKLSKYHELMEELKTNGFDVNLVTLEVGSRGFVTVDGFLMMKDLFLLTNKQFQQLLKDVAVAAIMGSYRIWTSRNHQPD